MIICFSIVLFSFEVYNLVTRQAMEVRSLESLSVRVELMFYKYISVPANDTYPCQSKCAMRPLFISYFRFPEEIVLFGKKKKKKKRNEK